MANADRFIEIFHEARHRPPGAERERFIDEACAGDTALKTHVLALIRADAGAGDFLQRTVVLPEISVTEKPGDVLGRYKLRERLGEGGCGVVYVADQEEPVRRRVALKVIKLGMDTRAVVARFEAERQALAMMDHPNIARVFDAGATDTGRPYFVMELVRGVRITEYCDQNRLSTAQRVQLFVQVCQAIQHAHQKGVIHRDIKPSNILVTLHDGVPVPKVIGFGIAKATEGRLADATVYTQLHQFIGTPAYMSPEQAEMSGLDIDTRSDIYSLGVLLYELLSGSTPLDAEQLMSQGLDAMRKTIREIEPLPPSTRLAHLEGEELTTAARRRSVEAPRLIHLVRGDLDWIVMKCLEKDRTRRYETANGLAMDLNRHLNNEPVLARPPTAAYRLQKTFRRNRLLFSAGAAVATALVIGIGVSSWQASVARRAERGEVTQRRQAERKQAEAEAERRRAQSEQQRADAQARNASESQQRARRLLYASDMNLAQQALKLNNLGKVRRLLDRHRPTPGEEDLRGWEWRYLWQSTRSSALANLVRRPAPGFSLSFSPDGRRLAVGWFDGPVELWDVQGRKLLRSLTENKSGDRGRVAFSAVSNLLAATSGPKAVSIYDLDSGRESVVWRGSDEAAWEVRDLAFSRDSRKLLIYAGLLSGFKAQTKVGPADCVWIVNLATGEIEGRHEASASANFHFGRARFSPDASRLYLTQADSANFRCAVQCVDLTTGKELWQTQPLRDYGLTALELSPDGRLLASGSGFEDPTIRVWDAGSGRQIARLEGHTSWVSHLVFSADGTQLISSATDQTIRIWNTQSWAETRVLRGHGDEVYALAVSEAAQLVASASKDGELLLWRADEKSPVDGYTRLPDELNADDVLPGGCKTLALPSGARPSGLACHAGLRLLAWTESGSSVFLASLDTPGRRVELRSDLVGIIPLFFSQDGQYLVAAARADKALRAWDGLRAWKVDSGQAVVSVDGIIRDAALASNGRLLVVAKTLVLLGESEMQFYDLTRPDRPPRRLPSNGESLSVATSPDGQLVAWSTARGEVQLLDRANGDRIETVHGHFHSVFGLAFSPDGQRLISASGGREAIMLWDVATRQELLTLSGTGSALSNSRWSPDGDVILAGTPWQAWRAPSWKEIAAAEANESSERKLP